jgi:hypothetical protein
MNLKTPDSRHPKRHLKYFVLCPTASYGLGLPIFKSFLSHFLSAIKAKHRFVSSSVNFSALFLKEAFFKLMIESFMDTHTSVNAVVCISSTTLQTVANSSVLCERSLLLYFEKASDNSLTAVSIFCVCGFLYLNNVS